MKLIIFPPFSLLDETDSWSTLLEKREGKQTQPPVQAVGVHVFYDERSRIRWFYDRPLEMKSSVPIELMLKHI